MKVNIDLMGGAKCFTTGAHSAKCTFYRIIFLILQAKLRLPFCSQTVYSPIDESTPQTAACKSSLHLQYGARVRVRACARLRRRWSRFTLKRSKLRLAASTTRAANISYITALSPRPT